MNKNPLQDILNRSRQHRKENTKIDDPAWVNRTLGVRSSYETRTPEEKEKQRINARNAIRENYAIQKDLIIKIFFEFHNLNREVDDKTYKKNVCKDYGINISHVNKICMARTSYIKECIGLTDEEINKIKQTYINSKPKYRIKTFGIDVIDLYKEYSYRSKFPVSLVWEVRFGKYKGMKPLQLEKALGRSLTRNDTDSFKKSYPWLTDNNSKELFYGDYVGATKFVKVLPTREKKFEFIKTGPYQGCFISYE
jgi:hypothetical protein